MWSAALHGLCLCAVLGSCLGARILGLFPTPSISHQLPFQAVMKALAERGHDVTVLSTDPLKEVHGNYTDVDLSFTYEFWKQFDFTQLQGAAPWRVMKILTGTGVDICHLQLSSDIVQRFIRSDPRFDVVFIEPLFYQCYYGLIHKIGSPPIIGLLSIGGISAMFDAVGNPNNPAYDPDMAIPYSDHMTFLERLHNTLYAYWIRYHWFWEMMSDQEAVMRHYFGSAPPTVWEVERNFSLVMSNNHWSMNYIRPMVPAYIELGSLHLQKEVKPLPKDLKDFLDGAKDGFIYFSLGSNIRSDKMTAAKRKEFLEAFAELPLRVLWKWESETLPGQPDNVKLCKWLPQQDVLAHPNIRLFITQGGLQSFQEAVHSAVPLVGVPFLADQRQNTRKMELSGIGRKLDFNTADKRDILDTVNAVLNDPSYAANMREFSSINKDQPQTPLERAVWWTEYVLRHNGAKHLRSAALDLPWYQYLLLDVIAVLLLALVAVVALLYVGAKALCCLVCRMTGGAKALCCVVCRMTGCHKEEAKVKAKGKGKNKKKTH